MTGLRFRGAPEGAHAEGPEGKKKSGGSEGSEELQGVSERVMKASRWVSCISKASSKLFRGPVFATGSELTVTTQKGSRGQRGSKKGS